jgi:hypothetical protein
MSLASQPSIADRYWLIDDVLVLTVHASQATLYHKFANMVASSQAWRQQNRIGRAPEGPSHVMDSTKAYCINHDHSYRVRHS